MAARCPCRLVLYRVPSIKEETLPVCQICYETASREKRVDIARLLLDNPNKELFENAPPYMDNLTL